MLNLDVRLIHIILTQPYVMQKYAHIKEDFFVWNAYLKQKTKEILFHFKR